ncbi:MAG: helix-turn-helix transcriptional regulator [Tunicatimonas sp.]|uniref:response regulator transcription factor n=1 Tax=Tunicatimonas sp. TaxID=1940096 RepID=UPI003C72F637
MEARRLVKDYQLIFNQLTKQEKEIILLVVHGNTSFQIGEQLRITCNTIETHCKSINRKLAIDSPYQLVRIIQAFDLV